MITITVNREMYLYDVFHITKAFYPEEEIHQKVETDGDAAVLLHLSKSDEGLEIREEEVASILDRKEKKRYINQKLYRYLFHLTGRELSWGILTGVRPTKLIMGLLEEGKSEREILSWMKENYLVGDRKASLGLSVAKKEKELLEKLDYQDGFSLYIGIPFCPSICSYCSFSSYPIELWKEKTDRYLKMLLKELSYVGERARRCQKKLNTVYIGGGTPTTLEAEQLDRLLTCLHEHFSFADLKEITVEAGRADSITREKLSVLKAHRIGRISINPQTMQQKTLDRIGRAHSVEEVVRVYEMARGMGFDNINMDLIAGLPGESPADFADTLQQIGRLLPDSLTVHALAMKRASRMTREKKECRGDGALESPSQVGDVLSEMIALAAEAAGEMNLLPYYLYRQKNIAGNFENVGYAKVDKAGIYNILIMEEKQSIIGIGAGSSTKIVLPKEQAIADPKTGNPKRLIRTENVKDVDQYIQRIDEMIERKGEWLWH